MADRATRDLRCRYVPQTCCKGGANRCYQVFCLGKMGEQPGYSEGLACSSCIWSCRKDEGRCSSLYLIYYQRCCCICPQDDHPNHVLCTQAKGMLLKLDQSASCLQGAVRAALARREVALELSAVGVPRCVYTYLFCFLYLSVLPCG